MNQEQPTVSQLIAATFAIAAQKNPGLPEARIRTSFRLGGMLPTSTLMVSIQQDGNLDALLRIMEDERAASQQAAQQELLFKLPSDVVGTLDRAILR